MSEHMKIQNQYIDRFVRALEETGFKPDNRIRDLGDVSVYVPSEEYGIVEVIHNLILQQVVDEIAAGS